MSQRMSGFLPSLGTLVVVAGWLFGLLLPLLSGDLGWHLRVGQYTLEHDTVPYVNFLSYTAPWHTWVAHEWLAGVVFAEAEQLGGLPLLFVLRGALFSATLLLALAIGQQLKAESVSLAALASLLLVTLALHVSLRPWLFGNLFLVGCLWLLEPTVLRFEAWRRWWLVAPILVLWLNMHGSFVVGVALALLAIIRWFGTIFYDHREQLPRVLAWSAVVSLLVIAGMLANPYGLSLLLQPLFYAFPDASSATGLTGVIKEWEPIDLDSFFGRIYVLWCALLLLAAWYRKEVRGRPDFILGLIFAYMTFYSQRHLPVMALFMFPAIAFGLLQPLGRWIEDRSDSEVPRYATFSRQNIGIRLPFLALSTAAVLLFYLHRTRQEGWQNTVFSAKSYPILAVEKLRQVKPGRIFNHYDWAGLIAWKAPEWPLFITPVNDAFPRIVFEDWLRIVNMKPGWEDILERYQVDMIFLPPNATLVQTLSRSANWRTYYEDNRATILMKVNEKGETPKAP